MHGEVHCAQRYKSHLDQIRFGSVLNIGPLSTHELLVLAKLLLMLPPPELV